MTILGIDYGLKRIGLAISDGAFASPLGQVGSISEVARIAVEHQVQKIIIGIPAKKDDRIVGFGERLTELTSKPVEYFDETYSTKEARKEMIAAGTSKKKRRTEIDQNTAAYILQSYIDSKNTQRPSL